MIHAIAALLVTAGLAGEANIKSGTQFNFQGNIALREEAAAGTTRKTFDLTIWVFRNEVKAPEVFWLIEERGRGGWPWSERFGRMVLDEKWTGSARGPSLLYERGDGRSVVPLALPFFMSEQPLSADATWKDEKFEYHVDKAENRGTGEMWQVSVRDAFGLKRQLIVDAAGVVASLRERVVMDKGKEYALTLEKVGNEVLAGADRDKTASALRSLVEMRNRLNQALDSQEVEWKAPQVALLNEQLPRLEPLVAGTPFERVLEAAKRDIALQSGRAQAVSHLSDQFIGKDVEPFTAATIDGDNVSADGLRGKVTILHFWEYRDEPLKEPYGQVGYLDFIHNRRNDARLQVYGVAVDGRLLDEKSRPAAVRSVKKLRDFMNLSYPILLDGGKLLKQFGDPRPIGAALPLFVVVDAEGKIVHYHVGHYAVHHDQGLKELDEFVGRQLEKAK